MELDSSFVVSEEDVFWLNSLREKHPPNCSHDKPQGCQVRLVLNILDKTLNNILEHLQTNLEIQVNDFVYSIIENYSEEMICSSCNEFFKTKELIYAKNMGIEYKHWCGNVLARSQWAKK